MRRFTETIAAFWILGLCVWAGALRVPSAQGAIALAPQHVTKKGVTVRVFPAPLEEAAGPMAASTFKVRIEVEPEGGAYVYGALIRDQEGNWHEPSLVQLPKGTKPERGMDYTFDLPWGAKMITDLGVTVVKSQTGERIPFVFNLAPESKETESTALAGPPRELALSGPPGDSDGDGLSDALEAQMGTDPQKADTDGDGLPDGAELAQGRNPLVPEGEPVAQAPTDLDSDGDGLTDDVEAVLATDPYNPDTDGDGIPDRQDMDSYANVRKDVGPGEPPVGPGDPPVAPGGGPSEPGVTAGPSQAEVTTKIDEWVAVAQKLAGLMESFKGKGAGEPPPDWGGTGPSPGGPGAGPPLGGPGAWPPPVPPTPGLGEMPTIPDVAGKWNSNLGVVYEMTQNGNQFDWTVAALQEKGKGTISGEDISASWSGVLGSGSAKGRITNVDSSGRATRIEWGNGAVFTRQ